MQAVPLLNTQATERLRAGKKQSYCEIELRLHYQNEHHTHCAV